MEDNKKAEIKSEIEKIYDDFDYIIDLAKKIEHDYIFGNIASNEHYHISEILAIAKEVKSEKEYCETCDNSPCVCDNKKE